jgi:hypothetical protein
VSSWLDHHEMISIKALHTAHSLTSGSPEWERINPTQTTSHQFGRLSLLHHSSIMGAIGHILIVSLVAFTSYLLLTSNSNRVPSFATVVSFNPPASNDNHPVKLLDKAVKLFDGTIYYPFSRI